MEGLRERFDLGRVLQLTLAIKLARESTDGTKTEEKEKKKSPNKKWTLISLPFKITMCAIVYLFLCSPGDGELVHKTFQENLEELKQAFPSQPESTWNTISKEVQPALRGTALRPTILVLVLPPKTTETGRCLARHLARKIASSMKVDAGNVHGSHHTKLSSIGEFYEKARIFTNNGVLLVEEMDKLNRYAAVLLLSLTNQNDISLRNAVVVLTIYTCSPHAVPYVELQSKETSYERQLAWYSLKEHWGENVGHLILKHVLSMERALAFFVAPEDNVSWVIDEMQISSKVQ